MATNMPGAVDTFTNPAPTDVLTGHATQHTHLNDAVLATENLVLATPVNTQLSSYTLVAADISRLVEMSSPLPLVVTIPPNSSVPFPIGTTIRLRRQGTGSVTVTPGTAVTLRSPGGRLVLASQYSEAALRKRGTNEWVLSGDTALTPPDVVGLRFTQIGSGNLPNPSTAYPSNSGTTTNITTATTPVVNATMGSPGDRFLFAPGTYTGWNIRAQANQTFVGLGTTPGAVVFDGAYSTAAGVHSAFSDPTGVAGVTIANLTVKQYTGGAAAGYSVDGSTVTDITSGAIDCSVTYTGTPAHTPSPSSNWVIDYVDVIFNRMAGVRIGDGFVVKNSHLNYNGVEGYESISQAAILDNCEIAWNNTPDALHCTSRTVLGTTVAGTGNVTSNREWGCGGGKLTGGRANIITHCEAHHNDGTNFWDDVYAGCTLTWNYSHDNNLNGIQHEIGYDDIITDNLITNAGQAFLNAFVTVAYGATPVNGSSLAMTTASFTFNVSADPRTGTGAGFTSTGQFSVPTASGPVVVTYTGITSTSFTGCTVAANVSATASQTASCVSPSLATYDNAQTVVQGAGIFWSDSHGGDATYGDIGFLVQRNTLTGCLNGIICMEAGSRPPNLGNCTVGGSAGNGNILSGCGHSGWYSAHTGAQASGITFDYNSYANCTAWWWDTGFGATSSATFTFAQMQASPQLQELHGSKSGTTP